MVCESSVLSQSAVGLRKLNEMFEASNRFKQIYESRISHLDDESWLEFKKTGLGGSEVGVLMGVSDFNTPVGLFYEKRAPIVNQTSIPMRRGKILEPLVVELFEEEYGYKVWYNNTNCSFVSQEYGIPFMSTPDGIYITDDGRIGVLECKTAAGNGSKKWWAGIPPSYYIQTIYNAGVIGADEAILHWLVDDIPGTSVYPMENNYGTWSACVKIVQDFYNNNMLAGKEPDPIKLSDYQAIYKDALGIIDADASIQLIHTINEFQASKLLVRNMEDELKVYKKNVSDLQCIILKEMGGAHNLLYDNCVVATYNPSKNGGRTLRIKEQNITNILQSLGVTDGDAISEEEN